MRNLLACLFLSTLLVAGALAQSAPAGVLTPAPVPNRAAGEAAPADRAGRPDGAERAAPFSGLPSSVGSGSGQASPATLAGPESGTAPSPSLSR